MGLVSKEMYTGIWEYGNLIDINCPVVIKFSSKKQTVTFFGNSKFDISSFFNGEIKDTIARIYEDPGNIPDDKMA